VSVSKVAIYGPHARSAFVPPSNPRIDLHHPHCVLTRSSPGSPGSPGSGPRILHHRSLYCHPLAQCPAASGPERAPGCPEQALLSLVEIKLAAGWHSPSYLQ